MKEITVKQFRQKIDNNQKVFLLDVREPFELYQSKISYENSMLIPVDQLSNRLNEIEDKRESEVVCLCRSGSRSAKACKMLEREGFSDVKNLKGGINQWARDIENNLPVY